MTRSTIRLGLIGFGRLPRLYYAPALRSRRDVGELLVADPLESSRNAARTAFPAARLFQEPGELLAQQPDGVMVASPPSTHLMLWRAAAREGIPVFMEKPFLLEGELAEAAVAPAEQALLMIDFNRRFWPLYREAADLVRSRALGEVASVQLTLRVDPRPWCSVTAHRMDPREGGVLFDLGSQMLDLAVWLAGDEPSRVHAVAPAPGAMGGVQIDLDFRGGARARCAVAYGGRTGERLTIEGSLGRVRLPDPNMRLHLERGVVGPRRPTVLDLAALGGRGIFRGRSMSRRSIALAIDAFVGGIRRSVPFSPGFADAVRNARLLDAAARSIHVGAAVELDTTGASVLHG